jgi:hypothetical protein
MKTLIVTLAILTCSLASLPAKDGTFVSKIISDGGGELRITLSSHEWLKITNFTQVPTNDGNQPAPAGVAVFNGVDGIWARFATDPRAHLPHEDLFVGGPAVVVVSPPQSGATVFLTYQRGSD